MTTRAIWRWYVYELVDPRDGQTFYVGKGSGNRVAAHERDAERTEVCSEKLNRIRDIWAADEQVERRIVAYFKDERAAYAHEAERIDSYGLDELTNLVPGGGGVYERGYVGRAQPESAPWHRLIRQKASEALCSRMAEWLRAGGHKGARWVFTAIDPAFKLHAMLSDATYNSFFPSMWEAIRDDSEAMAALKERVRPYGVELVYGGA